MQTRFLKRRDMYMYIYIYTPGTCEKVLYFGGWTLQNKIFSNQNQGHLGSRYVYNLYIYILHVIIDVWENTDHVFLTWGLVAKKTLFVLIPCSKKWHHFNVWGILFVIPGAHLLVITYQIYEFITHKTCMYGIFTYIYHQNQPNVCKYTIRGSYG